MPTLGKDYRITDRLARSFFVRSWITTRRNLFYPKIVEVHDSFSQTDFATFLGTVPQIEEVIDDVDAPPVADFLDFRVDWTNRLYKSKISISRGLLDFDQTGQVMTLLHSMAARLANWPEKLFMQRLENATDSDVVPAHTDSTEAYFAASHTIGSASAVSNLLTGSTSEAFVANTAPATVAQQIQADFRLAVETMLGYTDDRGEPFHNDNLAPESLVILCGPALYEPMRIAFSGEMIAATQNMFANRIREIIPSNYIGTVVQDGANEGADWYLFHVGERNRPFVYSRFRRIRDDEILDSGVTADLRKAEGFGNASMDVFQDLTSIQLETNLGKFGMNAEADVIAHDRFMIGARWRGEIFGGEWRNAIKINNG